VKRSLCGSRVALATIAITASTLAPGGSMAEPATAADKLAACHVRTLPVDGRVLLLGIHADSHVVDYLFAGEVGRAGGRRLVDYSTGAQVDAQPVQSIHASEPLLSPTGLWVAHEKRGQGQPHLLVERIDGSDARTCATSDGFLRALAFSTDERLLVTMSARGNEHRLIVCDMQRGLIQSWSTTTLSEQAREALRPRLHGRPPWMIDFAHFSPDATKILSGRIDGQVVLWDIGGNRRQTMTVANFSPGSMGTRFSFDADAAAYQLERDVDPASPRPKFVVSRLFPKQA
jgi:WD40 repeat protein